MRAYRADLHIHTVLSPCASLEMSPVNIIAEALNKQLDMIAVTDHNHTGNCLLTQQLGERAGISVLLGAEITTKEEIHCLAYLPHPNQLMQFQAWLDSSIQKIENRPQKLGYQLIVDEAENILEEVKHHLGMALLKSIEEVEAQVHTLGGLFLPAHTDRLKNSLYSQLGFVPQELRVDAFELLATSNLKPELASIPVLHSSDAHCLNEIGRRTSLLKIESCCFEEFRMALHGENRRKVLKA